MTDCSFLWLVEHAARTPRAPCVGTPSGGWLDYQTVAARTGALAAGMRERGVGPGERVLLSLPNGPASVCASLAVQSLGACAVELGRDWSPESLGNIVARVKARFGVLQGRDAALWKGAGAAGWAHLWLVHSGPVPARMAEAFGAASWEPLAEDARLRDGAEPPPWRPDEVDSEAVALLVFTSGSTGAPRGVLQSHRNVAANARSICEYLELGASDRAMAVLPLSYSYGKSVFSTHLLAGGSVFFDPRFMYPRTVLEAMASERCTGFAGVPLNFELLRRQVDVGAMEFPALRYVTCAGGALEPQTQAWARAAFAPARFFVMYGQTEATARLSYLPPERAGDKPGSIGRAIPGVELRVVDEGGAPLPPGAVGELVARGENITRGYLDEPQATQAILRQGWLWTGDLARSDEEGFFFIEGRVKDVLKVGGYRISPEEVERVLLEHPGVGQAAVVGAPDPLRGEVVFAFVVPGGGEPLDEAELQRHCRERMPAPKVPKAIRFVDALPRTPVGKVAKAELKARARAEHDSTEPREETR